MYETVKRIIFICILHAHAVQLKIVVATLNFLSLSNIIVISKYTGEKNTNTHISTN